MKPQHQTAEQINYSQIGSLRISKPIGETYKTAILDDFSFRLKMKTNRENTEHFIKHLESIENAPNGSEQYEFNRAVASRLRLLQSIIDKRNEVESKAHALFTEPLSNGQTFAHLPEQCDPLGFVTVLRSALEQVLSGKKIANPFILLPASKPKE